MKPVTAPAKTVPVAVMLAAEMLPENSPLPCTESAWLGLVVPMPTLPVFVILTFSAPAV